VVTVAVTGVRTSAVVTGAWCGATYPTGGQFDAWFPVLCGRQVEPFR
jgi:hypothetical protein